MNIAIFGLTITSSWGNGHATTYRSLCKALGERGHTIHFLEKMLSGTGPIATSPNPISAPPTSMKTGPHTAGELPCNSRPSPTSS